MSIFDEKIAAAKAIIDEYNSSTEAKIDFEDFLKKLKQAGGTTDAALCECKWEDFDSFGISIANTATPGIPLLVARQIVNVFRSRPQKPKFVTEKKTLGMSLNDLLECFDPKDAESPTGKRLKELSKSQRFLVFNEDNSLNKEASLNCLNEILEGHEPREIYVDSNGIPLETRPIGFRPNDFAAENPLLAGQTLRGADESCGKTFRSWKEIPHKIRVLLRLALDTRELVIDQVGRIHDTLDLFTLPGKDKAIKADETGMYLVITKRFPKAILRYRELEQTNCLPPLKIVRNFSKKHDPFFGSGNRTI